MSTNVHKNVQDFLFFAHKDVLEFLKFHLELNFLFFISYYPFFSKFWSPLPLGSRRQWSNSPSGRADLVLKKVKSCIERNILYQLLVMKK